MRNYSFIDSDKALQIAAAKSFKEGHGVTVPIVDPSKMDSMQYRPLTNWPPLYSIMIAGLSVFTDSDFYLAAYLFDVLALLICVFLLALICKKLGLADIVIIFLLLWKACAISDYVIRSSPTDMIALDALLFGVYMSVKYISTKRTTDLIFLIIAFSCAALLKYLYLPITIVIGVLFFWNSLKEKNNQLRIASSFLFIVPVLIFTLLFIYHYRETGQIIEGPTSMGGFYPGNLTKIYPVFWEAFMSVDFVGTQLSQKAGIPYQWVFSALQITSSLLLLTVIGYRLSSVIRHKVIFYKNDTNDFFLIASCISFIILIELLYLSLTNHMHLLPPVDVRWTYIMQPRYFLFIQYFFFIYIAWLVFKKLQKSPIKTISIILLLAMFAVEFIHGITTAYKTATSKETSSSNKRQWNEITSYISEINEQCKKTGRELVIVSPDYGYIGYGVLKDIKVIRDTHKISDIRSNSKHMFLLIKQAGSTKGFEEFLAENYVLEHHRIHGTAFYKYSD